MSIKPHICGTNRTHIPESGCSDCATPISDADIVLLTPLECYRPPCEEPIVCQTTVCCAKVACDEQEEVAPTEVSE